jgi:LmbE family N-acetylglucosaminyl deacetylase
MNPYYPFVTSLATLVDSGKSLPLGGIPAPKRQPPAPDAPVVLIFSPHPDDECLIGGFPLRLMREAGMRVINVAVTLGSKPERQQPRLQELKAACEWIGFELEQTAPQGLEKIHLQTRSAEPEHWARSVEIIAASLRRNRPRVIFVPHAQDWNRAHIGTHFLVMDALQTLPAEWQSFVVFTEYWAQMPEPNLLVESSREEVADLMAAMSFHAGELQRNPYHLRMPAWLQDNVRRGAEVIGGQGGEAPDYTFATLYDLRQWKRGRMELLYPGGRKIGCRDACAIVFG